MLKSFKDLFADLSPDGSYSNLQVILSRKLGANELPSYYLWVSKNSFGKVRLDSVDFNGSQVILSVYDCTTHLCGMVSIDIDDHDFQFL